MRERKNLEQTAENALKQLEEKHYEAQKAILEKHVVNA